MADGRKNNGGHSTKGFAGRKPKCEEIELIERLTPMEDEALEKLFEGVKSGDYKFIALYMAYRFGKPKEKLELSNEDGAVNINAWIQNNAQTD